MKKMNEHPHENKHASLKNFTTCCMRFSRYLHTRDKRSVNAPDPIWHLGNILAAIEATLVSSGHRPTDWSHPRSLKVHSHAPGMGKLWGWRRGSNWNCVLLSDEGVVWHCLGHDLIQPNLLESCGNITILLSSQRITCRDLVKFPWAEHHVSWWCCCR